MTKEDFKKIYESKKELINNLLALNNRLDTYRTNINILIYNIFSNDKMIKLPDFNNSKAIELADALGNLLNGTIKSYDLTKFLTDTKQEPEEQKTDKKGVN